MSFQETLSDPSNAHFKGIHISTSISCPASMFKSALKHFLGFENYNLQQFYNNLQQFLQQNRHVPFKINPTTMPICV